MGSVTHRMIRSLPYIYIILVQGFLSISVTSRHVLALNESFCLSLRKSPVFRMFSFQFLLGMIYSINLSKSICQIIFNLERYQISNCAIQAGGLLVKVDSSAY